MAVIAAPSNGGFYFYGLSSDTKPEKWEGSLIPDGSTYEEYNTGNIFKRVDGAWQWREPTKALDHNRAMMGLGLSYKACLPDELSIPSGQNGILYFNPGDVIFHHAEGRILKLTGGKMRWRIYRDVPIGDLPAKEYDLDINNQKGLDPADRNSPLAFSYHGNVSNAALALLIAGKEKVDTDFYIATAGGFFSSGSPDNSALPSGRHYDANTEYLVVLEPANGDIDLWYSYLYHDKASS